MPETEFDLIVLGGGPGGYVAAIRSAQLGLKTALVEREHLGGICLNWGCIPTKALLRSSEINHLLHHLPEFGFSAENIRFDLTAVVKRSRAVAKQLSSGVAHLLRKNKVTVFDGSGKLAGGGKLAVEKEGRAVTMLAAKHIVLATGARARELPGLEADGKLIWTYKQAMVPTALPKRLLVIGSGAIGIEFASFYRNMGADVTVVEVLDRILPVEDAEISAFAHKAFERQGMKILVGAKVTAAKKSAESVTVTLETGTKKTEIVVDRVISAVGIVGNVEGLGLAEAGVRVEKTHVVVDEFCRTGVPGLYAIGDLVGPPWLAHKASHEGVVCVEKIAGVAGVHPLDVTNIPGCTYCRPQIASVGLTEAQADHAGIDCECRTLSLTNVPRAIVSRDARGVAKLVAERATGRVLGIHLLAQGAGEAILAGVYALEANFTVDQLASLWAPYLTMGEAIKLTAQSFTRDITELSCCAV